MPYDSFPVAAAALVCAVSRLLLASCKLCCFFLDLLHHNLEFKGAEFFDNYYLENFPLSKDRGKNEAFGSIGHEEEPA